MTSKWRIEPLREVVSYIAKGIPPAYVEEESETTVRVLNQKCNRDFVINYGESRLHDLSQRNVPQEKYLRDEDILINSTGKGTAGRVAQLNKVIYPTIIDGHMIVLRPNEKLIPQYLGYALKAHQGEILQMDEGSTGQTELNRERLLSELIVSYPVSLDEQRAIANTLSALDERIDINGKINHHLEQMAQAVFNKWFVINKEAQEWEPQTLEQHIQATKGISYKGEGLSKDSGTPMHNLNSVYEGGGYKYEGIKYYTGEYRERHLLNAGDIIVANTEQGFEYLLIGFPAIIPKHFGQSGIFSHHIFRISILPTSPLRTHYLYFLLMSPNLREQIIGCTNGTTVNMLSVDGLKLPTFKLPPRKLIQEFEELVSPIFEKMELLYNESRQIADLRDDLLPRLMSGELCVADVDAK